MSEWTRLPIRPRRRIPIIKAQRIAVVLVRDPVAVVVGAGVIAALGGNGAATLFAIHVIADPVAVGILIAPAPFRLGRI